MNMGYEHVRLAFLSNLGPMELLLIFLIIFVVFGADKLPKIARDLGKGIKEFKKSISGENDEDVTDGKDESTICVKCGTKLKPDTKFCPECGKSLKISKSKTQ
jgi:sec-independent protein translocase protein TatA